MRPEAGPEAPRGEVLERGLWEPLLLLVTKPPSRWGPEHCLASQQPWV